MIPTTLPTVDAVLAVARALLPVRERAGAANAGVMVEAIQRSTGTAPPAPWCASFVAYCGTHALGDAWPLPRTASCDVLLTWARRNGKAKAGPLPGDVFLRLKTDTDADHAGFVTDVAPGGVFRTIEGNTNPGGGREGDGVYARTRGGPRDPARYLFVRWQPVDALPLAARLPLAA